MRAYLQNVVASFFFLIQVVANKWDLCGFLERTAHKLINHVCFLELSSVWCSFWSIVRLH